MHTVTFGALAEFLMTTITMLPITSMIPSPNTACSNASSLLTEMREKVVLDQVSPGGCPRAAEPYPSGLGYPCLSCEIGRVEACRQSMEQEPDEGERPHGPHEPRSAVGALSLGAPFVTRLAMGAGRGRSKCSQDASRRKRRIRKDQYDCAWNTVWKGIQFVVETAP